MTNKELYKIIRKLVRRRMRLTRKAVYGDHYYEPTKIAVIKRKIGILHDEIISYEKKLTY